MLDSTLGDSVPILGSAVIPIPGFAQQAFGSWSDRAICAGEDPEIFFPVFGDPAIAARRICANCPVRPECLQYASDTDEHGIWGGLDRGQRRALRADGKDRDLTPVPDEERELA